MAKKERILKWQGGKSSLMSQIKPFLPTQLFDPSADITFIDAFTGGGSVTEYVITNCPGVKRVLMNDYNRRLMETYWAIKTAPSDVVDKLSTLSTNFNNATDKRSFYNNIRDIFNETNYIIKNWLPSEIASAFIFLNKTSFNGIYRENPLGLYNVPWGKRDTYNVDVTSITDFSLLLNRPGLQVQMFTGDYKITEKYVTPSNTFIYFDPPYRPLSGMNSFTEYTSSPFNDDSQRELKNYAERLNRDYKALSMVSNSYDPNDDFFKKLYKGWDLNIITALRSSGGTNSTRGQIQEYLIRNYK